MSPDVHLEHLRRELDAFAARLSGDLTADVPCCPGWDVETLINHVGQMHRFALRQLEAGPGADLVLDRGPAPTESVALIRWYHEGAERLFRTLGDTDPDEHRPNWASAPTSAWYFRRMAQEMAVHRWDIESAHGLQSPIDAELAVDGVDEIAEVFLVRVNPSSIGGDRTAHLHATDEGVEGEWVFTFGDEAIDVTREHAKGDVAARASASDLLLMLWNRKPRETVETFGDTELLDTFLEALSGL